MSNKSRGHRGKPSSPHGAKGPSQRQLQTGELIRHALVDILQREDLRDPALHNVSITLSEARMSPDLKHATIFCSPLGQGDGKTVAEGLNRCAGFLRGRLGREVDLRYTPNLHFIPDQSFAEASHIQALLDSETVRRDLERKAREDAEAAHEDEQGS